MGDIGQEQEVKRVAAPIVAPRFPGVPVVKPVEVPAEPELVPVRQK